MSCLCLDICLDLSLDYELLHVAARISDLYYASQILQVYPECIHAFNCEKVTPLHLACLHGLPSMIQFLLDQELKLKVPSVATLICPSNQFSPLQLACVNPHTTLSVMKSLLRASTDFCPLETMVWKYKLLHITAMGTNVQLARYFLDLFPQALAITSNTGCLPIRFACMTGSSEMVQLLLDKGMQKYDDKYGLLLYKEDLYSESTFQLACSNTRINSKVMNRLFQCVQISTNRVLKENLLHKAVQANNFDVAKLVLQRWPMSLVRKDKDMNLPLHVACSCGSTKMLRLIFSKSIKNILSKRHQNWDTTISLSIFEKNNQGQTPWNLLCHNFSSLLETCGDDAFLGGAWPCIKLILYLRAGVLENRPSRGVPLLHAAIMMIEPLDVLLAILVNRALRCDVCVTDYKRRTVLHVVAKQQTYNKVVWCDIIEYLVDVEKNGRK
jgi:ankyrin repeat protein